VFAMYRRLGAGGKQQVFQHGKHMYGDGLVQLIWDTLQIHQNPVADAPPMVDVAMHLPDLMLPDLIPEPPVDCIWVTPEEAAKLFGGFIPEAVEATLIRNPVSLQSFVWIDRVRPAVELEQA
ncbi:unnamed protein product, partial [Prorocentrum cordatum]